MKMGGCTISDKERGDIADRNVEELKREKRLKKRIKKLEDELFGCLILIKHNNCLLDNS